MNVQKLEKKSGTRLKYQDTYKVVCDDPEKYIRAIQTFKYGNEVGSGLNEFVHVALGKLKKFNHQCVIKVHFTDSKFTNREINIMKLLKNCPYVVKHICTYSCLDDTTRWMEALTKPQHTCGDSKSLDKLTFMIMDYIPNGDVVSFLKIATNQQIKALFIQCALAIIDMGIKYDVSQGDFNSGNILITLGKSSTKKIQIGKNNYTFKTHGVCPLFIDFGRGYVRKQKTCDIIDDITTLFTVFVNYIPLDNDLKETLRNMVLTISRKTKPRFSHVFKALLAK